jgi:predicted nucleic acid-binding protein
MPKRCFIDTNVIIYAHSNDEPAKQRRALALLRELLHSGGGVLSTQVLQEFANVALRKLGMNASAVREQLAFLRNFEVMHITPETIDLALQIHEQRHNSFYDALIRASAEIASCTVLYSEDMNAGETLNGVTLVNPFAV